jgi:nitric oxide reductase NorQ protein
MRLRVAVARGVAYGGTVRVITPPVEEFVVTREPFYVPQGDEAEVFAHAARAALPVLLKGPTGVGKTRFVTAMAHRLGRPLVTVACHEDLSASDLVGRFLLDGDETVWVDGPLTAAVRHGAVLYLDEVVEARKDTLVVIHPLSDDRRMLPVDRLGTVLHAPPGFLLVMSYNPGYQSVLKDLKPSTRQRFVSIDLGYPGAEVEARVLVAEGGVDAAMAQRLVRIAGNLRNLADRGLEDGPGTRTLVHAARLIASGLTPRAACEAALVRTLTDSHDLQDTLRALVHDVV